MTLQWISDNGHYLFFGDKEPYILSSSVKTEMGATSQVVRAPGQDGATTYNPHLDQMVISFEVTILIAGTKNVPAKVVKSEVKNNIAFAFMPNYFGSIIVSSASGEKYARCRPVTNPGIKSESDIHVTYGIELISDFPTWRGEQQSAFIGLVERELVYPVVLPAIYGTYSAGAVIYNHTQLDVHPVFEVVSQLESFEVENETTGEEFTVNHSLEPGEKMIIDTYASSVTLESSGSISNISHYVDGDFIKLVPGENRLIARNQSPGEVPGCTMKWRLPRMDV